MYAVSDNGGVYKIISQSGQNTHFGDYHLDNDSKLQLLSVITDQFGNREHFTGLTAGPADVENGRYSRILFATTEDGDIYTIDQNGGGAGVGQRRVARQHRYLGLRPARPGVLHARLQPLAHDAHPRRGIRTIR